MQAQMLMVWYLAHSSEWQRRDRNTATASNCRSVLAHYDAGQTDLPQRLVALALDRTAPFISATKAI